LKAGERKFLQTPDGELHDLDAVCPQPEAADPSNEAGVGAGIGSARIFGECARDHIGFAGDAAAGAAKVFSTLRLETPFSAV
jgi:hypothetical protein